MWVEYVGHFDEVEIDGYGLAARGEPIEVPDELAGWEPSGHPADGEEYDPGAGLLAQPSNWQPSADPEQSAKAAEAAALKAVEAASAKAAKAHAALAAKAAKSAQSKES